MVLYDKVTSGREVCEPGTGHECGGGIASGIISEPPVVCIGDEQVDRRGQAWVSADDRTECVCE